MTPSTEWQPSRLTDLAEFINGYAFKPEDWTEDGLPIVRIEQLRDPDGQFDYCECLIPPKNIIDSGDLIFSWSATLMLRIWQHGRAALNQHLFKVIERPNVDRSFLKAFIEFHLPSLAVASHGSTMQHITRKELARFTASAPRAKTEQTTIATILSLVEKAIEQTEAMLGKQYRIKTGLMQDLFAAGIDERGKVRSERTHEFKDSSLGQIPVSWNVVELGRIAHVLDPNPNHRYPTPCDSGVPLASTENFEGDDGFDLEHCETVPWSVFEAQFRRCQYDSSDVIFARKGRLGFARPYGEAQKVFSHTVIVIKTKNSETVINDFLLWTLRCRDFFDEIDKRMNSNSGVPTLGLEFVAAIPIRLPDPAEQKRIADALTQSARVIEDERRTLSKLCAVKTALMQDLLTGRKRVSPLLEAHVEAEVEQVS